MPFSQNLKHEQLRPQLWNILHYGYGKSGHAFHLLLIVMIITSLAILPLEFVDQLQPYHDTLLAIEVFTAVFFTMEYILRIYAAPDRWRYVLSWYGIIDLLSIAPFYLSMGLIETQWVRVLGLFRVIRVLKLGGMEAAGTDKEKYIIQRGIGLLEDERADYIVSRHPLYMILGCLPPLLATSAGIAILLSFEAHPVTITVAACFFLFALIFLWKTWLDFSYDVIYVTNKRLIMQNQYILGRSINQVNYRAITNVIPYYPGVLSYLLRFGSIKIETNAAEQGHIELHMVRRHEKAALAIMERCFGKEAGSK